MSEHNWKFGDWGREIVTGYNIRFVAHDRSTSRVAWLFSDGSIGYNRRCEYLPDCDGFDWKPVEPGEGYRLLDIKVDTPQAGDELQISSTRWHVRALPFKKFSKGYSYRRRVEPEVPSDPGEGYRFIDITVDEPQEGDEYWSRVYRIWEVRHSCKLRFYSVDLYRRKIAPAYRPFASKEEFEPHRDRWIANNTCRRRVDLYGDAGVNGMTWESLFRNRKFLNDDGTTEPCGVKQ